MNAPPLPNSFPAPSLYQPHEATITGITRLTPVEKLFRLELPGRADLGHQPGQFLQLSLPGCGEAPISVASSPTRRGSFELGIRSIGSLTRAMHAKAVGEKVGIRGPFGRPFPLAQLQGKDLLLISGGCGIAPLRSLIQYCEDQPAQFGKVTLLYGAKNPASILFKADFTHWDSLPVFACSVTVDSYSGADCYSGNTGLITSLIAPLQLEPASTEAVIVGPPAMYRPVISALARKGITPEQIIVSLERQMRCGVGKCGHCSIEHLCCCQDGPVFRLSDIDQLRGAF